MLQGEGCGGCASHKGTLHDFPSRLPAKIRAHQLNGNLERSSGQLGSARNWSIGCKGYHLPTHMEVALEDTKDKLRRNLVGFSALYLASAFLKISPFLVVSWFPGALKDVSPFRLQIITIVVLGYLAIRWFTSAEQVAILGRVKGHWSGRMEVFVSPIIDKELAEIKNLPPDFLGNDFEKFRRNYNEETDEFVIVKDAIDVLGWMRTTNVRIFIHFGRKGSLKQSSNAYWHPVKQKNLSFIIGHFKSAFKALKSEAFWEWIVPIVLAYAALWVMVWRFVESSLVIMAN